MDYQTLTAATLTDLFNQTFGKVVKVGTYTKAKMVADLEAHAAKFDTARPEEPEADLVAPDEVGDNLGPLNIEPIVFEEVLGGVGYPAPAPITKEEAKELSDNEGSGKCPLCGGDPANQTQAGEAGTFLGDSCNLCHNCGKTYNLFTGVEVPTRDTKKRRILNPQGKIDAKEAALAEAGFNLAYDKNDRLWSVSSKTADTLGIWRMTSKQFAGYSVTELVALAPSALQG